MAMSDGKLERASLLLLLVLLGTLTVRTDAEEKSSRFANSKKNWNVVAVRAWLGIDFASC